MDVRLKNVDLIAELQDTFQDVTKQLIEDEKRWGDTWKERGLVFNGQPQEERFIVKVNKYYEEFLADGTPIPWTKVLGEAHIALVREKKLK